MLISYQLLIECEELLSEQFGPAPKHPQVAACFNGKFQLRQHSPPARSPLPARSGLQWAALSLPSPTCKKAQLREVGLGRGIRCEGRRRKGLGREAETEQLGRREEGRGRYDCGNMDEGGGRLAGHAYFDAVPSRWVPCFQLQVRLPASGDSDEWKRAGASWKGVGLPACLMDLIPACLLYSLSSCFPALFLTCQCACLSFYCPPSRPPLPPSCRFPRVRAHFSKPLSSHSSVEFRPLATCHLTNVWQAPGQMKGACSCTQTRSRGHASVRPGHSRKSSHCRCTQLMTLL